MPASTAGNWGSGQSSSGGAVSSLRAERCPSTQATRIPATVATAEAFVRAFPIREISTSYTPVFARFCILQAQRDMVVLFRLFET